MTGTITGLQGIAEETEEAVLQKCEWSGCNLRFLIPSHVMQLAMSLGKIPSLNTDLRYFYFRGEKIVMSHCGGFYCSPSHYQIDTED